MQAAVRKVQRPSPACLAPDGSGRGTATRPAAIGGRTEATITPRLHAPGVRRCPAPPLGPGTSQGLRGSQRPPLRLPADVRRHPPPGIGRRSGRLPPGDTTVAQRPAPVRLSPLQRSLTAGRGHPPATRTAWLVNLLSPGRILADARAARRAGSQFTVVFLHWGQEYRSTPTPTQRTLARRLLADPSVDLTVDHHAHVVQPVQRVNGKWVAFGMGNLLSAQSASCCPAATQDGVLLQVTIVHKAGRMVVGKVSYIPTWLEHPSYRILPVAKALARGSASPATRALLRRSPQRTTTAIGRSAHQPGDDDLRQGGEVAVHPRRHRRGCRQLPLGHGEQGPYQRPASAAGRADRPESPTTPTEAQGTSGSPTTGGVSWSSRTASSPD
jgi:hypothetical protein